SGRPHSTHSREARGRSSRSSGTVLHPLPCLFDRVEFGLELRHALELHMEVSADLRDDDAALVDRLENLVELRPTHGVAAGLARGADPRLSPAHGSLGHEV